MYGESTPVSIGRCSTFPRSIGCDIGAASCTASGVSDVGKLVTGWAICKVSIGPLAASLLFVRAKLRKQMHHDVQLPELGCMEAFWKPASETAQDLAASHLICHLGQKSALLPHTPLT